MMVLGTRVAYSRNYLKSTGQITGSVPFLRGTVREVHEYNDFTIVHVKWDKEPEVCHINIKNLVEVDRIHLEAV